MDKYDQKDLVLIDLLNTILLFDKDEISFSLLMVYKIDSSRIRLLFLLFFSTAFNKLSNKLDRKFA